MIRDILLNILDTKLRRWANTRVERVVAGKRLSFVMLSNGFCGLSVSENVEGKPSLSVWEPLTPRTLARRAEPGIALSLALAALAATYSVKLFLEGFKPIRSIRDFVGEAILVGGKWLEKIVRVSGNAKTIIVGEDFVASNPGKAVEYARKTPRNFLTVLAGASPTPCLASRLGFKAYIGLYVRPEFCKTVEKMVLLGHGVLEVVENAKGVLLHGGLLEAGAGESSGRVVEKNL